MAQTIRSFVSSTRLWHRLFLGGASLAFHGLVVGVLLLVVDLFWPGSHGTAIWVALAWLVLVLGFHVLRRGASLHAADRTLGLRDQLITWCEMRGERSDPVSRWLEDDLERAIEDLPPASRSPLWRRSARRLWWLLPALLLVWWIGPLGRNLGMHSASGETRETTAGMPRDSNSRAGPGTGGSSTKPKAGDEKTRAQQRPATASPVLPPPTPPPGATDQQSPATPPRPLLPLPAKDEFVIPRFLGDDKGDLQRMRVAVVEQGEGTSARPKRKQAVDNTEQEDRRPEFQAAAERALRARHVPRSERPFVKRYFEALLEGRR